MELFISIFLTALAVYFSIGFLFGIYFLFKAPKIDPSMAVTKRRVRFLLFPGITVTWPFLIHRLFKSKKA